MNSLSEDLWEMITGIYSKLPVLLTFWRKTFNPYTKWSRVAMFTYADLSLQEQKLSLMLENVLKTCNIIKPFNILGFLIERKPWQKKS